MLILINLSNQGGYITWITSIKSYCIQFHWLSHWLDTHLDGSARSATCGVQSPREINPCINNVSVKTTAGRYRIAKKASREEPSGSGQKVKWLCHQIPELSRSVGGVPGQRLRRWPGTTPTLDQRGGMVSWITRSVSWYMDSYPDCHNRERDL